MPRGAAVVYPKDAARIVGLMNLHPGSRIAEAGVGSGALTCSLLKAVGSTGRVFSFERREEFAKVAEGNVETWFGQRPEQWTLTLGDLTDALQERELDAVVLDMLAPRVPRDRCSGPVPGRRARRLCRDDDPAVEAGGDPAPQRPLDRAAR